MYKFKKGDCVCIIADTMDDLLNYIMQEEGVITEILEAQPKQPYKVKLNMDGSYWWCNEADLESVADDDLL